MKMIVFLQERLSDEVSIEAFGYLGFSRSHILPSQGIFGWLDVNKL
jgi:hypothetical protein